MTRTIEKLDDISAGFDVVLCDLWGCVHDGVNAFPDAVAALTRFRERGGVVLLLTNSPRSATGVEAQLERLGVPCESWDAIVSSGDASRRAMFSGAVGKKVWFVGGPADRAFFDPPSEGAGMVAVQPVELREAEGIVCCGPFTLDSTPDDLKEDLAWAAARNIPFLCANPDISVDRGGRREYCAGAFAQEYLALGGESLFFGKPHAPIYELSENVLAQFQPSIATERILAIGDGLQTDILGAVRYRIASLFVTGGLAAKETGTTHQPDPTMLDAFLHATDINPDFCIGHLR